MSKKIHTYEPTAIANHFILMAKQDRIKDLTPMKLIKLVYIAYAWHLALHSKPLFNEKIEAWPYGPVIPSLYHEFKRFGNTRITEYLAADFDMDKNYVDYPIIDYEKHTGTSGILYAVWKFYKHYSAYELSELTHMGEAWKDARKKGEPIMDDKLIIERAFEAMNEKLNKGKK